MEVLCFLPSTHYPLYDFDWRATHARTLLPAALASVSFGIVLVRVRVRRGVSGKSLLSYSDISDSKCIRVRFLKMSNSSKGIRYSPHCRGRSHCSRSMKFNWWMTLSGQAFHWRSPLYRSAYPPDNKQEQHRFDQIRSISCSEQLRSHTHKSYRPFDLNRCSDTHAGSDSSLSLCRV